MEFNPDSYLSESSFNPDSFLSGEQPTPSKPADEKKGEKEAIAKGQVYVKPFGPLSAEQTAGLYSFAERASSGVRGIGQMLSITGEEEVKKREALEKSPEYGKTAKIAGIAGTIAEPTTYAIPMGKAATLGEFIKQSAVIGGVSGFVSAKTEEDSRGKEAVKGVAGGLVGGTILGTVARAGGKLFGKDFLPWKATAEEKAAVKEDVLKEVPEEQKEEVAKQLNHFLESPEDKHINAKKHAEDLINEGASPKKVEKAIEKNPLVGHYLDEYRTRYEGLKESKIGEVKQGEVLPPEPKLPAPETSKEPTRFLSKQAGITSPQLAADIAGAGVGATLSPDDPLTGAVEGAALAHGGVMAIEKFAGKNIGEKIVNKLASEAPESTIKESQQLVASTLNEIRSRERNVFSIYNDVNKLVPDVGRRENLSTVMEHPELAKNLLPTERQAYNKLKSAFDDVGKRATDAEVIRGMRENYITHIVDWDKSPTKLDEALDFFLGRDVAGGGIGLGRTTSKYGKERKYETIEDLTKALKDSGLVLKTKDASEIFRTYANSMEKAIAGKNMVRTLKDMKLPDGVPLLFNVQKGGFVPSGWQTSKSPFLQGYAIHPELAPVLEHMFSSNSPGSVMKASLAITNMAKRLNVTGSFFHAASLTQALISSGFGTAAKEIGTGFKGTREAVKAFQKGGLGDAADKWIKSGLVTEVPGDVDKAALAHIGRVVDGLASKAGLNLPTEKVLGTAEKTIMGGIDKVTWDYAHTGFKLLTAEKFLEKAKLDHPDVPEEELRKEIVKYVNNSFGSLNWTQIAADTNNRMIQEISSPKGRQSLNLLMFAPDWTASTLRSFTSAFGKGSGLKGLVKPRYTADFARRYQMRSALIYLTVLDGMNQITSGHHIWENKKDPTRIEFRDGTTMQMSKHAMEPAHWILHPEQTLSNKLGFLPHAAITYWGEKQYPFGPELEDKSPLVKMERIGEQMLPFQVQAAVQAPTGQGVERAVMGTLGMPIYGMTNEERAKAKVARQRRINELRRDLARKMAQ